MKSNALKWKCDKNKKNLELLEEQYSTLVIVIVINKQFWIDVFRTTKIYQTGKKYYLTHDQDSAFFLFIGAYTYSYSLPIWVMFFFQNLLTFLKNYRIANIGCFNFP